MSQPDLERTLRTIRPIAPPELRERVRLLAAQPIPPRALDRWRRPIVLAVPLAAALAAALVAVFVRDHGPRPRPVSSPAAKSAPLAQSRAAAPAAADSAGTAAAERAVVARARGLGGKVVSRRVLAHAVELRLRFPRGQAGAAATRLAALPGTVRVHLIPRGAGTVVVRVSRP